MFGIIIGILVLFVFGGLFSRPRCYHRPLMRPFGGFGGYSGFGGWGMGRPMMHHHPHHHHHHMGHGPMGHGPMGHGRRW